MNNVISLKKGETIDLSKETPGLVKAMIGLGWDENKNTGYDFDLDASVFLLNEKGVAEDVQDFVFYHNLKGVNGCCVHQGDNLTGDGDGDDEQILIDFEKIPERITRIAITVTIYDAEKRKQNFGQVSNAYIRIVDDVIGKELVRFDLGEDFSTETAVIVAELYKERGSWNMKAIGSGYEGGLSSLARKYGLNAK